ncbi:endoplasmic reticulum membrane-associated RNA degradation protein-like, partial [Plakobranchus ocellatus]
MASFEVDANSSSKFYKLYSEKSEYSLDPNLDSNLCPALQNLLKAGICFDVENNISNKNYLSEDLENTSKISQTIELKSEYRCFSKICIVDGYIDFASHSACLTKSASADLDPNYYNNCVCYLAAIFKQSEDLFLGLDSERFAQKYHQSLLWTNNSNLFEEVCELLATRSSSYDILALLVLSSGLERALGNLFLLKGFQVPAMIKDLLITPELCEILGFLPLQVLQIVIGPPISMNIRNIAWHGFLSEGELPRRYIYFLLLLTVSLGKLLDVQGISVTSIPCRDFVSLQRIDRIAAHFS